MKIFLPIIFICTTIQPTIAQTSNTPIFPQHGRLIVSRIDPHFLSYKDGTPFFWLGDTGWEMLHLLNREEIHYYLSERKKQGFNVIQTVVISEFNGLTKPNAYGALPFTDRDPAHLAITPGKALNIKGEYDYWDHVDYAIDEAEKLGMFIALLPCWGEYVTPRENNQLFFTTTQAYNYGNFLGARYKTKKNIIWILGGDRLPDETSNGISIWRAMAKGIADGTNGVNDMNAATDYSTTLMTYHCSASSSRWFQQDAWLDLDMWGSYHANYNITKAFEQVYADDALSVIKPTINGEPAYEDHPVNWLPSNGVFTAYDVRQIAYWSVFAGACGHTYGNASVWQFYDTSRAATYNATKSWKESLKDDGANQLQYLKNLIESRPVFNRRPAQDLIAAGEGVAGDHCVATQGEGYAFFYLPTGMPVTIKMNMLSNDIKAAWYDPRTGNTISIGEFKNEQLYQFAPPGISKDLSWLKTGRGCDWVLVLDDANSKVAKPGGDHSH
ncbi:MAG TPA: glycoside hydrolase family 140 protein [Parafilimonas sp.]|nr:glycoside hydrolase family 140 protein [Parafilimonas sp.]